MPTVLTSTQVPHLQPRARKCAFFGEIDAIWLNFSHFWRPIALFTFTLLASIAQANPKALNDLEAAILRDNPNAIITLLLAAPTNGIHAGTPLGPHQTPALIFAMQQESWQAVDALLLAPGLDLNMRSPQGETPLMLAALRGQLALTQKLINAGAHINQPGWAALHYAASADLPASVTIAQLLLEHHAYIDAASPNGSTPVMLAAQYGSQTMVELLIAEGADVDVRNQLGLNAVDFALRSGRDYLAQIIQNAQKTSKQNQNPASNSTNSQTENLKVTPPIQQPIPRGTW